MKILTIGDSHITEKSIPELQDIFAEIFSYGADKIIHLGDFYHRNKPTPAELEFGTYIVSEMKKRYKEVVILAGNGSHEILNGRNVVEYFKYLDIQVSLGDYIFENKLWGHFMLHESKLEYGTGKCGIKDLKDYDLVLLGHQHSPQKLTEKIFHLSSVRFQNFNELSDPYKQIAILEDNNLTLIPLKSPIPMIEIVPVEGNENEDLTNRLENTSNRTKVRIKLASFNAFKNTVDVIKKYKSKFEEFKIKLDFERNLVKANKPINSNNNLEKLIIEEIKNIKDNDVRNLLEEQFKL